jgi:hypothetical protein
MNATRIDFMQLSMTITSVRLKLDQLGFALNFEINYYN